MSRLRSIREVAKVARSVRSHMPLVLIAESAEDLQELNHQEDLQELNHQCVCAQPRAMSKKVPNKTAAEVIERQAHGQSRLVIEYKYRCVWARDRHPARLKRLSAGPLRLEHGAAV